MSIQFRADSESEIDTADKIVIKRLVLSVWTYGMVFHAVKFIIHHRMVFTTAGARASDDLLSVAVTLFRPGLDVNLVSDRESFYNSFRTKGLLFQAIRDKMGCEEQEVENIVSAVQGYLLAYCEGKGIAIFAK